VTRILKTKKRCLHLCGL